VEDFAYRHRNVSLLVVVLVAQFVLLGYQVRRNDDVRLLRVWAVAIIMPFQKMLDGGTGFVGEAWKEYVWLRGTRGENQRLKEELDRLKLEQLELRRTLARFEREGGFFAYQKEISSRTLLASVIAAGADPNAREVFVNKGSGDGIQPGMAVITPDGVVGKVQAAFPGASLVLLLSDPDSAVGVVLQDSREHGVMKGTGGREGRVDYIGNEVEVPVGTELYTSGDDRIFPKGLPVGVVTRARPGSEFQQIYARPFSELNRLEEVLIITQGVHQPIPERYQPQAPSILLPPPPVLLPPPPAIQDPLVSGQAPAPPAESGSALEEGTEAPVAQPPASSSDPLTDADLLEQRYRALGAAQGHTFGEGVPGSKPPDFNMGLTPPPSPPGLGGSSRTAPLAAGSAPPAGTAAPASKAPAPKIAVPKNGPSPPSSGAAASRGETPSSENASAAPGTAP
jgi:rod shape-determining protein MreC